MLDKVFAGLQSACEALHEALHNLSLTVIEDRPVEGEVLLVERLGDLVACLQGWAEEASQAAGTARRAVGYPQDFNRARGALAALSAALIRAKYGFFGEALHAETLAGLRRFGRERGREWLSWTGGVAEALEACSPCFRAADEALALAWTELTERLAARGLSLTNTNIGLLAETAPRSAGPRADGPRDGPP
jgi:hypothetical protein